MEEPGSFQKNILQTNLFDETYFKEVTLFAETPQTHIFFDFNGDSFRDP